MDRFLLLDNRDSFTHNLRAWVLKAGYQCRVVDHHQGPEAWEAWSWDAAILGPGPGTPPKAGRLMSFVDRYAEEKPLLGICLGHQALGLKAGAQLVHASAPVHGKRSFLRWDRSMCDLFQHNYKSKVTQFEGGQVMRYHSLVLDRVPETYQLLATASDDGTIQVMRHRSRPLWGYQFHPESIATDSSQAWLQLFVENALHPKPLSLKSFS